MSGSLNQHVERPPAAKGAHTEQDQSVDPADLLEHVRECEDTGADGGAGHSQDTASNTSFLHLSEVAGSQAFLLLIVFFVSVVDYVTIVFLIRPVHRSEQRGQIVRVPVVVT